MAEVNETPLPGVGMRHEFRTRAGEQLGVVSHRAGHRELVVYDRSDPDSVRVAVTLTAEEATTLADLLGGSTITQRLDDLTHQLAGMSIDWVEIEGSARVSGQRLGDTELRKRTGASIVALLRGDSALPAPGADDRLEAGSTAVIVGTPEAVVTAADLLRSRQ